MVETNIKIGNIYINLNGHYLYMVKNFGRKNILNISSPLIYTLENLDPEETSPSYRKFIKLNGDFANHNKDWKLVEYDLSDVEIFEGMIVEIPEWRPGEDYFVYDLKDGEFNLIPKDKDPVAYIKKFNGIDTRSQVERAQRLLYTGWWVRK